MSVLIDPLNALLTLAPSSGPLTWPTVAAAGSGRIVRRG